MPPFFAKSTIGKPFIELTEVESTNIYAMEQVQANMAGHGTAFYAWSQTAGKGQQGKTWIAEPGANITVSVVLDCSSFAVTQVFELSLAIALASYDFFSIYAGGETRIKWPNDIYWRDRKAGGILIENVIRGDQWSWAIVGIGININQVDFPEMLKKPVSLKQITGKEHNTRDLAWELCGCIEKRLGDWAEKGAVFLLGEYNERLYKKGETVKLKKKNIVFSCMIQEVNSSGELVTRGAAADSFRFGEVEWLH